MKKAPKVSKWTENFIGKILVNIGQKKSEEKQQFPKWVTKFIGKSVVNKHIVKVTKN